MDNVSPFPHRINSKEPVRNAKSIEPSTTPENGIFIRSKITYTGFDDANNRLKK